MTANEVINLALSQIGTKEEPANSNNVKYNTWYYGKPVSGSAYPWCMTFIQWLFAELKAEYLLPIKTASCGTFMKAAQKAGLWVTSEYLPGDIAIYDFPGGGNTDHTGLVISKTERGLITI